MADNILAPLTGDGDATANLAFDEFADGSKAGVVRLDLGSGTAEARVVGAVPVKGETGTASDAGSTGTVDQTANGTQVVASNATRKGLFLWFDQDVRLLFSSGNVSAATSYLHPAYAPINFPLASGYVYTGAIKALALSATAVNYYRAEFQ